MNTHLATTSLSRRSNYAGIELKVEYVPIGSLSPPARQVRRRTVRKVKEIARSIEDFGHLVPLLTDAELTIVAGHGRWEAAKLLGHSTVPIIRVEHLNKAQLRLFSIADNKLPEGVHWDKGALLLELQEIEIEAPHLDLTSSGFQTPEIDTMYGQTRTDELSAHDEQPKPRKTPISQLGDHFRLGRHDLLCADARDKDAIAALLMGRRVRLLLSDPPWNLPIAGVVSGKGDVKHDDFVMASGEMTKVEFTEFLAAFLSAATPNLIEGALAYIYMDWRNLDALTAAANACQLQQKNLLVWCKDNGGLGSLYRSQHELIGLYKFGDGFSVNNVEMGRYGRNRSNLLFYPGANSLRKGRKKELESHPTCKPVSMLADIILDASHRDDVVLDPFGGSGSTLIAAEKTDRTACLVELDPRYVDVIVTRFQDITGTEAIHVRSDLTFAELTQQRRGPPAALPDAGHD